MARVFNGNMWSGIGNGVNAQRAYRDQQRENALDSLASSAMSIEKMVANNNMRNAIIDFYNGRKKAAQAAANAEAIAAGDMVDDQLAREQAIYDLTGLDLDYDVDGSIFAADGTINTGGMFNKFQEMGIPFKSQDQVFAENFDPNAKNSVEDIQRMQRLMGMDENDIKVGKWGPKSRAAYNRFKGV